MAIGYLTPMRHRAAARGGQARPGSLFDLHRQMNGLFDELFDRDGDSGFYARAGISAPAMDIHQDDKQLEITAELPGVKEEDVEISVEDGVLTLRGEKRSSRDDEESGYRERSYGSFERRIALPSNIDENACSAHFEDGVLKITLPKTEEKARGRRIPVGRQAAQGGGGAEEALIEQDQKGAKADAAKDEKSSA
jgi:HSP20 family protein